MLVGCYQLALGYERRGISLLRRACEEAARQQRPYEEALAVVQLGSASRKVAPKVDEAFRCLREMGAAGLLDYLPKAQSAPEA